MKVTEVKTFLVFANRQNWLFVKVMTDEGVYGWGEASVEGQELATEAAIKTLAQRAVIGQDPSNIEYIWQKMYRQGFWKGGYIANSAMAGIDQALWDIKGKVLGVPVYTLLGGRVRDKIKTYTHAHTPEEVAECVEEGFAGVKTQSTPSLKEYDPVDMPRYFEQHLKSIRDYVGYDVVLCVDAHGRGFESEAIQLLEIAEKYNLYFLEEPAIPENVKLYQRIHSRAKIPIAGGERWYSRWDYREILELGAVDIIQPDVTHCGGISEIHRIASMAEIHSVRLAPHNPNGPVATAASIQVAAAEQNFDILEFHRATHMHRDVCSLNLTPKDGYFEIPTTPGLGFEMDESIMVKNPYVFFSFTPTVKKDGTPAEI